MTPTTERQALRRASSLAVAIVAVALVVAVATIVVVLILGRFPQRGERAVFTTWVVAAAGGALAYPVVARKLGRIAARRSAIGAGSSSDLVRSFTGNLPRSVPMDELLLQLVETLRAVLLLESAEVWTGWGDRLERTVALPDMPRATIKLTAEEQAVIAHAGPSGAEWARVWLPMIVPDDGDVFRVAPIANAGELFGLIVVRGRPGRGAFDGHEEHALAELARHVGLALRNVRLDSQLQASLEELRAQAAALQASRARLVAAADGERRRLERDLHDGAQQHLIALAMNIRMARSLLDEDPRQAATLLDDVSKSVEATVDELRALAHGIYPPLLADRGLGDALAAAARRSAISVTVSAKRLKRYAPEVESAVYFCCLEAIQNAAKHSGDGAVTLRLWEEAGALRLDVTDDGEGFDVDRTRPGAGIANMSDRLGAIGGSLRVESAPGRGTTVSGTIPLPDA